ncbi:MAG: MBOAT family O-acyltransferase [Paludibacteraceae bacterium]|nr:MBOAT family O-acyltransferase [Paludibacteraceae bacterium]
MPHKWRNWLLLIASYYFYMCWNALYAILIIFTTISTWKLATMMNGKSQKIRKILLSLSVTLNLSILFTFKYYDFLMSILADLTNLLSIQIVPVKLGLLLPVGISFYTFQAIGYSIDVYRRDIKSENHLGVFALFISFFPQLVAGPIERASHLLPQFKEQKSFSYEKFRNGLMIILFGFFLKLGLADRCAIYVDSIFNNISQHNGASYLLASFCFTFQIYGDFFGYSLIAIGSAKMLGYNMCDNFNRPYLSTSITEFWHRWHISLSSWFRDYVYIPFGGSRCSGIRRNMNLMATMLLSGLWHGASMNFVVWGGLHGIAMCVERTLGIAKAPQNKLLYYIRITTTFIIVCFLWIFFRADTLTDALTIISGIFTDFGKPYIVWAHIIIITFVLFIVAMQEIIYEKGFHVSSIRNIWLRHSVRYAFIVLTISFIMLFGVLNGDQFIYFQF